MRPEDIDSSAYPTQIYIHPSDTDASYLKTYHDEDNDLRFFVREKPNSTQELDLFYIDNESKLRQETVRHKPDESLTSTVTQALFRLGVFQKRNNKTPDLEQIRKIVLNQQATINEDPKTPRQPCMYQLFSSCDDSSSDHSSYHADDEMSNNNNPSLSLGSSNRSH